jgi:uncharacterized protein (TIGR00299 family) protein
MKKTDARLLFIDGSSGASGDMILGALVDLGVPLTRIRQALDGLPLGGWSLRSRKIDRCGIAGRKIDVRIKTNEPGRGFSAIKKIIDGGELDPAVRQNSLAIFRRLIDAEAEAHGLPPAKVHLHEAGSADAIIDIVGAAAGLHHLSPERIVVSSMTTGFGRVRCDHGEYPVPGPATLLLTRGVPVRSGDIEVERLTPTGAAILTHYADDWGNMPAMRPAAVGYGGGDHDLGKTPNMLRMVLGSAEEQPAAAAGEIVVIECAIDDSTPQELAFACEKLLETGALDVQTGAVTMKKGRSGHQLTVLARPDQSEALARLMFEETSTIGLRFRGERRIELERSARKVETGYGEIRVKLSTLDGEIMQIWPEYDDCAKLARRNHVPLRQVQQAALRAVKSGRRVKRK